MMTAANTNRVEDFSYNNSANEAHDAVNQARNGLMRGLGLAEKAGWSDKDKQLVAEAISLLEQTKV